MDETLHIDGTNHSVHTDDHTWFVKEDGSGQTPFVWLHGWGHTHESMERIEGLFKADGKHLLFDQPGFGKTPMLEAGAGTEDYADALAKELERHAHTPAIIIGHSLGGRVAVQLAARHPELVKAIVLIAGAGIPQRRSVTFKIKAFILRILGRLARLSDKIIKTSLRSAYEERFGSSDYKTAGALRPTFVRIVNENLTATARTVRSPSLLIYGSEDTAAPVEVGKAFERAIPLARLEVLKGFGHIDILSRGAYQCEALIRAFLRDLDRSN